MENINDIKVIKAVDYKLPQVNTEQGTMILTDIAGTNFEIIYMKPTTKEFLEMEEVAKEYTTLNEILYAKNNDVKKIEWILKNLVTVPGELKLEHLNKESAKKLANYFR